MNNRSHVLKLSDDVHSVKLASLDSVLLNQFICATKTFFAVDEFLICANLSR
jgi:hypothetical protein